MGLAAIGKVDGDGQEILDIAVEKKIDFIHPGYGFLSENPDFAKACDDHGILFCGPSSHVLSLFGDKLAAKQVARESGVAVIPGTTFGTRDADGCVVRVSYGALQPETAIEGVGRLVRGLRAITRA